jgi:hypothetical protein
MGLCYAKNNIVIPQQNNKYINKKSISSQIHTNTFNTNTISDKYILDTINESNEF